MSAFADAGRLRFGYRLKVPLALTGVALISGVSVALTTYALVDRHVEANAEAETQRLTATLARALVQPVLRGDVWQAHQTVRAAAPQAGDDRDAVQVIVLDAQGQVFASPSPRVHPLGQHLSALPEPMTRAARLVYERQPPAPARVAEEQRGPLVLAAPIVGDEDVLLGVVLAQHPRALTDAQRGSVVRQLVGLGALAIVVVALAGAALGLRITAPLERLRMAMRAAPARGLSAATARADDAAAASTVDDIADVCARDDEVGELGRSFASMLDEIAVKHELERHMLQAERMASIGQLSAGIAHEVNNPLGGMLAAIENRRLRGDLDEHTGRTLALLERGLRQVHGTVQALLNEARSEGHPLANDDLRDLELLLRAEADRARCRLHWALRLPQHAMLPAVPVRQVVLNLTLNAIAAAGARGEVDVRSRDDDGGWQVQVANSGAALDEERLAQLTQGSQRSAEGRLGLGLWITARILHTLGGRLRLAPPGERHATVLVADFVPAPTVVGAPAPGRSPDA